MLVKEGNDFTNKAYKIISANISQFKRFVLVGIVSTLTHVLTLFFCVEVLGWHHLAASTLGFILAVVISYFLNYRFTFLAESAHGFCFPRYVVVCTIGLVINITIMYITVDIFKWWYILGQISTLLIVPLVNFTLNRFWTFK